MKGLPVAVFAASLALLGWNAGSAGIATSYVDPVGKIPAQDEAVYGASSIAIAHHARTLDDWLTPRFLHRFAFYKPPLLYWISALALKAGMPMAWGFRAPSILAGALAATLIFLWLRVAASLAAAFAGTILLLSSHLFFVMSRVELMDALLTCEIVIAMYALSQDPQLESRRALWTFGIASGLAIMTKSSAGLFPILILFAFFIGNSPGKSPGSYRGAIGAILIAFAVAAPWHIYELLAHGKWFWNEYILTEQIAHGMRERVQSTNEGADYYLKRLLLLDPVLLLAGIAALWKSRPRLLIVWMVVILAGCAAFQYRNTSYLLPVYPALALLVASAIPRRFGWWAVAAASALLIAKASMPSEPWGIPFAPESVNAAEAPLAQYAALDRPNGLILVDPADEFYSADLELAQVRYLYIDPHAAPRKAPLDFEYLGVTVTAEQFNRLDELRPAFAQRLHEWGIDKDLPIACVILARDRAQANELMERHPEADFFVDGKFLLSGEKIQRP